MSQPVQPPNPPQQPYGGGQPAEGNPYAQQQPGTPYPPQPGAPTGNPFAGQQPGQFGGGNPFAPAAPVRNSLGLGILAAVVAALVSAGVYGGIIGATEHEIGYAAVGVGFLVGFAAGKVGGRNPVLPVVGAVLALVGVYGGQLLGEAIIATKVAPVTVSEMFFDYFGVLNEAWKEDSSLISYLFFVIAAVAAFSSAKKAAG
ncbi:hypothetical protein ACQSMD_21545 [Streptomyces flavovirens]|uniref:hypothetical protein n=1 Tax=Streptomyces TaxID=1883 RepID=UPI00081AF440|nr:MULTISPECIES: hypothetical protein [unclassified Streptomyces]MYU32626.1 hypothetical protein [Streptomyces sp. SID8358]SCE00557.1 hypothetical protein GA0115239_11554 [Streptomyces sp. BpilaLS-43]